MKRPPPIVRYLVLVGVIAALGYLVYYQTKRPSDSDTRSDSEEAPTAEALTAEPKAKTLTAQPKATQGDTKTIEQEAKLDKDLPAAAIDGDGSKSTTEKMTANERTRFKQKKKRNATPKKKVSVDSVQKANAPPAFFPASKSAGDLKLPGLKPKEPLRVVVPEQ